MIYLNEFTDIKNLSIKMLNNVTLKNALIK